MFPGMGSDLSKRVSFRADYKYAVYKWSGCKFSPSPKGEGLFPYFRREDGTSICKKAGIAAGKLSDIAAVETLFWEGDKWMEIALHYEKKGSGEPFLLLHGNGEDSSYFKNQIEYFSSKYCVIALDTRGHGASPRGSKPFTIEQFACDLYDFMLESGLSNAIILGFSDGANIAMKFAMKHPDMVKALILNGGNLNAKGVKGTTQIPIEIGYRIARLCSAKSARAERNAEMLGLMVNDPDITPEELAKITAPTLVICGTKDMIKESHTEEIAENISNAKLVMIEGDHFIANKRYEKFNHEVDDFLKKICKN